MVGFVFQLGATSCGCFEHNGWVQLFQGVGHQQSEAVAAAERGHSHGSQVHSHGSVSDGSVSQGADTEGPCKSVQDLHDCEPSAISDAVLAQQVQLPSNRMMTCLLDSRSDSNNRCGSRMGQSFDRASLTSLPVGPARFVTQAFLL